MRAATLIGKTRTLAGSGVLIALVASGGCASYSIEPGLWTLSFRVNEYGGPDGRTLQRNLDAGPMHVEVVPRFNSDVETVEVWLADEFDPKYDDPARKDLGPMTGTIQMDDQKGVPVIRLEGRDDTHEDGWHFVLSAEVRARDRLRGGVWGRRKTRLDSNAQGSFEMVKVTGE